MREVYLRPFEDAVKLAGTSGIVSSFSKRNSTYAGEVRVETARLRALNMLR